MNLRQFLKSLAPLLLFVGPLASQNDDLLKPGTPAPEFTLADSKGTRYRLSDYHEKKPVVLFFYPGDETPGCTKQLCAVRDDYALFTGKNAVVFGINPGSGASHEKFTNHHRFSFPLLVDEGMKIAKVYGCGGIMVRRTVYVIDPKGYIVYAHRGMPPNEDIVKMLDKTIKPSASPEPAGN